jgi:hypothetical protein
MNYKNTAVKTCKRNKNANYNFTAPATAIYYKTMQYRAANIKL